LRWQDDRISIVGFSANHGNAGGEKFKHKDMLKKGEHIEGVPGELQLLLNKDKEAKVFFETLARSHKQAYCDWVGSAKQEATRTTRAEKAILMLKNKQKTLKTV
jgi:uncharacterized protein YdeI (YjbR/CyaY-like superfamily)